MSNLSQAQIQLDYHSMAFLPIHKYILNLIPLLEYRQEIAKRKVAQGNSDIMNENLEEMIKNCNEKIQKYLSITPF